MTKKEYYAKQNSKTPNYMYPPETLDPTRSNFYVEGDVWSFGLLVLDVCSPQRKYNTDVCMMICLHGYGMLYNIFLS